MTELSLDQQRRLEEAAGWRLRLAHDPREALKGFCFFRDARSHFIGNFVGAEEGEQQ